MANGNTSQMFTATLVITDSTGAVAVVQGAPVWASSDETIVSVTASADGMTATIPCVAPGTARVSVSADADLGAGVVTITGVTEDIVVTLDPAHVASIMTLTLGAPVPKA